MADDKFTFTRAKLRALRSPERGWKYYYDADVRGLALGVGATGAKSFRVNRKIKGLAKKITLGVFDPEMPETQEFPAESKILDYLGNRPALNVRMARKLAMSVMTQLDAGSNPAEKVRKDRNEMTLGELFALYRSHLSDAGKKTVPELARVFERYLGDLPDEPKKKHGRERTKPKGSVNWQRRPLSAVGRSDVSSLRLSLGQSVGHTTANRAIEVLRAAYNYAIDVLEVYSGKNPASKPKLFDVPERGRFLETDEVSRFFAAVEKEVEREPNFDFTDYILLSIYTGARRGNLLRMKWDELNLEGARWTVSGEKMKNGQNIVIPLVEEAVQVLTRRAEKAESGWVFPGGTPAGHMGSQRKKWARLLKRARISDLHLHDLRRSLGTWMTGTGASTVLTMRALGHRTMEAMERYQGKMNDPVRNAMQGAVSEMWRVAKAEEVKVIELPRKEPTPSRAAKSSRAAR